MKKRKADKITKLKARVSKLEAENAGLKRKVYYFTLKHGKAQPQPVRRKTKLIGNDSASNPYDASDNNIMKKIREGSRLK